MSRALGVWLIAAIGSLGGCQNGDDASSDGGQKDATVDAPDAALLAEPDADAALVVKSDSDAAPVAEPDAAGACCVSIAPGVTERTMRLQCACSDGICQPAPLGPNELTAADCARVMAPYSPPNIFPYRVFVTRYNDCALFDISRTAIDSPGYVWTVDSTTLEVVGVRYSPGGFIGPFNLDPVPGRLYCNLADAGLQSGTTQPGAPSIVAGSTAAGCTQSSRQQICPPVDGGLD